MCPQKPFGAITDPTFQPIYPFLFTFFELSLALSNSNADFSSGVSSYHIGVEVPPYSPDYSIAF